MHVLRVSLIGLVAVCFWPWAAAGSKPVEPFLQARWDRAEVSSNGLFRVVPLESEEEGTVILLISWWPTDPTVTHIAERPKRNPDLVPGEFSHNFKKEPKEPEPEVGTEKDWASILDAAETLLEGYDPWERFHENDDSIPVPFEPPNGNNLIGEADLQRPDSFGYAGEECPPCHVRVMKFDAEAKFAYGWLDDWPDDFFVVEFWFECEWQCDSGYECCGDKCCSNICCDESCCYSDEFCCNDECCPNDSNCCDSGCCPGTCCGEVCCIRDQKCCDDHCCGEDEQCCGDTCCGPGYDCCNDNHCCSVDEECCGDTCCGVGYECCNDEFCCTLDQICCNEQCCNPDACETCEGGECVSTCDPDDCEVCEEGSCVSECESWQNCCSGTCCDYPCYECIEEGTLTGGSVSGDPDPVCGGNTITFTVSGVTDSGGQERVDCHEVGIPSVTPTYTWVITQPVGSPISGSGPIATVEVDETGQYTCRFTATANRNCPPSPLVLDPETVTAEEIDMDVDSDNDGDIDEADDAIEDSAYTPQTPGKWLWINNDDTDGDGQPDNANSIIDGMDDLDDVPELWIRAIDPDLVPPGGTLHLETSDADVLRVFDGRWSGAVGVLGPQTGSTHQINPIPTSGNVQYGIEGVAPGTAELTLLLKDGGTVVCQDTIQVTVVGLEVAWETLGAVPISEANEYYLSDPPHAPAANPTPLGLRYFSGATAPPGGAWNDTVQVKITTSPLVQGVSLYLKALDPDDPSANDGNNVVDSDRNGGDNRDAYHLDTNELSATTLTTDSVGEAVAQFRVAHYAGDNHRIAATLKQSALDVLEDNTVPPSNTDPATDDQVDLFTGNISPLLTVWRKLWVERDSMAAPEIDDTRVTGTVGGIVPNSPVAGQTEVDLGRNLPDEFSDLDLYEGGEIVFHACPGASGTFVVLLSTSETSGHDWVTIAGVPGACANGSSYTLTDDDDTTVLPHFPDFGQFGIDAYARAYILPLDAGTQYQTIVGFDMHLSDWDIEYGWGPWDDGRQLSSSASAWSCLVVGCWEPGQDYDHDPDVCPPSTPGAEGKETGVTDDDSGRSAIYMQVIADDIGCLAWTDEVHTVTHEIGHTCGQHKPPYVPTADSNGHIHDTIMEEGAPNNETFFSPESLKVFREQEVW